MMKPTYLVLQIRDANDPILGQEIFAFASALNAGTDQFQTANLLNGVPSQGLLRSIDVVLIGGSGDYSATVEAPWLDRACELFRTLRAKRKPTFGSCWGFQALAKAFGGNVVHDEKLAELGTIEVHLTEAGKADPIFGPLGSAFLAPSGHEDSVVRIPEGCLLLGVSAVANQILCCSDAPIYGTQFHPELTRETYLERVRRYPKYVEKIRGIPYDKFEVECNETPRMVEILPRFVNFVLS